ncbi:MAG: cyclase family protein [Bacteroidetes bacterium]|nr:MAG: cyclase family protein [Bacteroidota bacterium]
MIAELNVAGKKLKVDLSGGHDISIPVRRGTDSVEAFYIPHAEMKPFAAGSFIGSVNGGGACNCENILFNAHGNGTHTECVGHVSKEAHYLPNSLHQYFFLCQVLSINPIEQADGDRLIMPDQIPNSLETPALAIRTLPNASSKLTAHYSGSNPIYLHPDTALKIRELGVKHLLIDQPSVDREEDGGLLAAHKNYWNYPAAPRLDATITEFIYIPDQVEDGTYLLNLMVSGMESDAVPSKPVLYTIL